MRVSDGSANCLEVGLETPCIRAKHLASLSVERGEFASGISNARGRLEVSHDARKDSACSSERSDGLPVGAVLRAKKVPWPTVPQQHALDKWLDFEVEQGRLIGLTEQNRCLHLGVIGWPVGLYEGFSFGQTGWA